MLGKLACIPVILFSQNVITIKTRSAATLMTWLIIEQHFVLYLHKHTIHYYGFFFTLRRTRKLSALGVEFCCFEGVVSLRTRTAPVCFRLVPGGEGGGPRSRGKHSRSRSQCKQYDVYNILWAIPTESFRSSPRRKPPLNVAER